MRTSQGLQTATALLLTPLVFPPLIFACGDTSSATANDAGSDGTLDVGAPPDSGFQPDTTACTSDPTTCLFGTAQADGFFVNPTRLKATLYRVFPSRIAKEVDSQIVAKDKTWAFSGLPAWAHYYLQLEPGFPSEAGVQATVATRVGPLAVPNTAGALMVSVKPVQIDVLEGSATGGSTQVNTALAHVFSPVTGKEVGPGATVSVLIGTTSTPMPWTTYADAGADGQPASAYYHAFANPPPAQPTYQVTTLLSDPNAMQNTWNLIADTPTIAATIASPAAGATVPVNAPLVVTWPPQPEADYYLVELFASQGTGFTSAYTSNRFGAWDLPDASDTFTATIPGSSLARAGKYLLNVAYTKAYCPATSDGCVHASTVANEQITVQ